MLLVLGHDASSVRVVADRPIEPGRRWPATCGGRRPGRARSTRRFVVTPDRTGSGRLRSADSTDPPPPSPDCDSSTCSGLWPTASCPHSIALPTTLGWPPRWTAGRRCRPWPRVEIGHYPRWPTGSRRWACRPDDAMAPFVAALETYHSLTEPSTWLESLVKAYVGDGMAADFYREVAEFVDPDTRGVDPRGACRRRAGRVRGARGARRPWRCSRRWPGGWRCGPGGWWARRSARPSTCWPTGTRWRLLVQGTGDLTGIAALIGRITDAHEERMTKLGLRG